MNLHTKDRISSLTGHPVHFSIKASLIQVNHDAYQGGRALKKKKQQGFLHMYTKNKTISVLGGWRG